MAFKNPLSAFISVSGFLAISILINGNVMQHTAATPIPPTTIPTTPIPTTPTPDEKTLIAPVSTGFFFFNHIVDKLLLEDQTQSEVMHT